MALPEETTRAVCHRDSPLSTNDAHDLLVGDEEPISRLPYRPMGRSVFKYFSPFSLTRDFGKQNTRGNVSKISVNLMCYRDVGSKSTNHSPLS